jgi:predicted membrane protein
MIIILIRIVLLILLIFSIVVDINIPVVLHTQVNQLLIAIFIIIILVMVDEIIGFLLGLIFLVVYFKHYQKKIKDYQPVQINLKEPLIPKEEKGMENMETRPTTYNRMEDVKEHYINDRNGDCIEMSYISNELLEKAQNNIYDINNYKNNNEIQGLIPNNFIQPFDDSIIESYYSRL